MLRDVLDTNLCVRVLRNRRSGHARSRGSVVVTGNLGEFLRVEGLHSEDWLTPQNMIARS